MFFTIPVVDAEMFHTYNTITGSNYKMVLFTPTHYVPSDEFQIGVMGTNGIGVHNYTPQANIISTPFICPTVTAYMLGSTFQ